MMVLPEAAEIEFRERVQTLKENQNMRYVTSIERLARKEGLQEGLALGLQEGIEKGIEKGREEGRRGQAGLIRRFMEQRFGNLPAEYQQRLDTAGFTQLSHWGERVLTAATLDEFQGLSGKAVRRGSGSVRPAAILHQTLQQGLQLRQAALGEPFLLLKAEGDLESGAGITDRQAQALFITFAIRQGEGAARVLPGHFFAVVTIFLRLVEVDEAGRFERCTKGVVRKRGGDGCEEFGLAEEICPAIDPGGWLRACRIFGQFEKSVLNLHLTQSVDSFAPSCASANAGAPRSQDQTTKSQIEMPMMSGGAVGCLATAQLFYIAIGAVVDQELLETFDVQAPASSARRNDRMRPGISH